MAALSGPARAGHAARTRAKSGSFTDPKGEAFFGSTVSTAVSAEFNSPKVLAGKDLESSTFWLLTSMIAVVSAPDFAPPSSDSEVFSGELEVGSIPIHSRLPHFLRFLLTLGDFGAIDRLDCRRFILDAKKAAEREEQKTAAAAKAAEEGKDAAAADADEEEETPAPENLLSTDAARPAVPDWKDAPDGMAAIYKEGCKQQPGHQADMMRDFAKQFAWTSAMAKGLVTGIASSKDARR